jgi:hypothetical protein
MADIKGVVEKPKGPNEEKPSSAGPGLGLFAFTIDASTGQITKLEKVDSNGGRRQLSEQEKAGLQASKSRHTLEAIVEQAFEAGIACALGSDDEKDDAEESEDDAEVRRILLMPLIERSRILKLLQPNVLVQAVLATALQQVTAPHSSEASGSSPQQKSGAAVKPHQSGSAGPAQH